MPEARRADRTALLRVGSLCRQVFGLAMPGIPGLCTIAADCDPAAVGGEAGLAVMPACGVGLDPGQAFAGCMGEAAERFAQIETPQDRADPEPGDIALTVWPGGQSRRWPRDLLLRRPANRMRMHPPAPLSIGCAAGPSPEAARMAAILEVIERDAVALWWRGGVAPRRIAARHPAARAAAESLARLGYPVALRQLHLLDITADLGVPVVAALSFGPDGRGFCCGTAARPEWAAAAHAATLELCQNELAVALAVARRDGAGAAGMPERDLAHLARHEAVLAAACLANAAAGAMGGLSPGAEASFDGIAARLQARGYDVLSYEHRSAWLGMAVERVIIPGLACEPSSEVSPRLARALAETGGGPGTVLRVQLFS